VYNLTRKLDLDLSTVSVGDYSSSSEDVQDAEINDIGGPTATYLLALNVFSLLLICTFGC